MIKNICREILRPMTRPMIEINEDPETSRLKIYDCPMELRTAKKLTGATWWFRVETCGLSSLPPSANEFCIMASADGSDYFGLSGSGQFKVVLAGVETLIPFPSSVDPQKTLVIELQAKDANVIDVIVNDVVAGQVTKANHAFNLKKFFKHGTGNYSGDIKFIAGGNTATGADTFAIDFSVGIGNMVEDVELNKRDTNFLIFSGTQGRNWKWTHPKVVPPSDATYRPPYLQISKGALSFVDNNGKPIMAAGDSVAGSVKILVPATGGQTFMSGTTGSVEWDLFINDHKIFEYREDKVVKASFEAPEHLIKENWYKLMLEFPAPGYIRVQANDTPLLGSAVQSDTITVERLANNKGNTGTATFLVQTIHSDLEDTKGDRLYWLARVNEGAGSVIKDYTGVHRLNAEGTYKWVK